MYNALFCLEALLFTVWGVASRVGREIGGESVLGNVCNKIYYICQDMRSQLLISYMYVFQKYTT
jgi:hypothetical protein